MYKGIISMINEGRISVEDFYVMHPFSATQNVVFSNALNGMDYLDNLYVISHKTFERLAILAKVSNSVSMNTIIVTGYRGCGKTNFLRFYESILKGEFIIENYSKIIKNYFSNADINHPSQENIKNDIMKTTNNIMNDLNNEFYGKDADYVINEISNYLNRTLIGDCEYINFDAGKAEKENLLKLKFVRHIEENFKKLISNKQSNILKVLFNSYCDLKDEIKNSFEGLGYLKLKEFFENTIKLINTYDYNYDDIEQNLAIELNKLEVDQLFLIIMLIKIFSKIEVDKIEKKCFYLFDNIDVISDSSNSIFFNAITQAWEFLRQMRSFIDELRNREHKNELIDSIIKSYDNINFVFAMRETTAMHINDHLRDRVREFSTQFDISLDIDLNKIAVRRKSIFEKLKESNEIKNQAFLDGIEIVDKIANDDYFSENLFPLFNNDYRTAIKCIAKIVSNNFQEVKKMLELSRKYEHYNKHGGRGSIFRILFNTFRDLDYFAAIDVFTKNASGKSIFNEKRFTIGRIILTILHNLNDKNIDKFFFEKEESTSISKLYNYSNLFIQNGNNAEKEKNYISLLTSMFSLRNSKFWSHLITFDNIFRFTPKEMLKVLNKEIQEEDLNKSDIDIMLRPTLAGITYLKTVCVHFEFFLCRFHDDDYPLFSNEYAKIKSLKTNSEGENQYEYCFENPIYTVFDQVRRCCNDLKENNKIAKIVFNSPNTPKLYSTKYVFDKTLHEERIIHHHISYIDAYRMYLINGKFYNDDHTKAINKKLIKFIEDYLGLLKFSNNIFYSPNSEHLDKDLRDCIEIIRNKDYLDRDTVIQRKK